MSTLLYWEYVSDEKRIVIGEVFVEDSHEWGHVILEEFRDILTI
jgi:hypothetical protein